MEINFSRAAVSSFRSLLSSNFKVGKKKFLYFFLFPQKFYVVSFAAPTNSRIHIFLVFKTRAKCCFTFCDIHAEKKANSLFSQRNYSSTKFTSCLCFSIHEKVHSSGLYNLPFYDARYLKYHPKFV